MAVGIPSVSERWRTLGKERRGGFPSRGSRVLGKVWGFRTRSQARLLSCRFGSSPKGGVSETSRRELGLLVGPEGLEPPTPGLKVRTVFSRGLPSRAVPCCPIGI